MIGSGLSRTGVWWSSGWMGPAAAAWRGICRTAQAGRSGRTLGRAGSLVRPVLCLKLFSVWWQYCTAAHLRTLTAPANFLA